MADELRPQDIRARKFGVGRRGYDRSEVASFLSRVAARTEQLESELAAITDRLEQLGITELVDYRNEIDALGVEIQAVLSAAMGAAEGMRTRAHADAARMITEAEATSAAARGDAWEMGTELLQQAEETAAAMLAEAREDALFIRAEAEQDAKRLVTDARRQADEMIRSSREEGEKIVVIAKAESEAILEGARQAAEKAQERARALENRRTELLGELEAAESAMRDLEAGQSRPGPAVGPPVTPDDDRTHWPGDDGAIRILPAAQPEPEEPVAPSPVVDAEEMAAEVARMRSNAQIEEPEVVAVPEEEPVIEPAPEEERPAEPAPEEEPVMEPAQAGPAQPEPEDDRPPEATELVPEQPEPEDESETTSLVTDKITVVEDDPSIAALFAALRDPAQQESEPEREPEPAEPEPEPVAPVLTVVPDLEVRGEFDRRDRMLLPIENTGLRGLKRHIVELQNRVLEELRTTAGEYRLSHSFVTEMMGDDLDVVLRDSYRAGHAAAAESLDLVEPQLTGGPSQAAAAEFAADLHRDVQQILEKGSAGGSRRLTADVGRVFRSWRTDDAERHVRVAARRAFNDGLLAGYNRLGISAVELTAPGRPCGRCAADTGTSWAPVSEEPPGGVLPPVGPACAALVVPLSASGTEVATEQ